MDYATTRFAENGYHPTSVAEIVTGLGVGKGVFYWYFQSKEELFLEILKEAQTDLRRAQKQAIADIDDPVRRIEVGIRTTVAWSAAHREVYELTQFAMTESRFAPAIRKGQEIAVGDTITHVRDGIARGVLRDIDAEYIGQAILGVTGQLVRTFIHERGTDPDEVADAAIAFILEGILVEARSPAR